MTTRYLIVAAALLAAVDLTACTTMTGRTVGRSANADDASITAAVKANLAADSAKALASIDVDTVSGTVYLNGRVKDPATKQRAESLARQANGVRRVVNNIQSRTFAAGDAPVH